MKIHPKVKSWRSYMRYKKHYDIWLLGWKNPEQANVLIYTEKRKKK